MRKEREEREREKRLHTTDDKWTGTLIDKNTGKERAKGRKRGKGERCICECAQTAMIQIRHYLTCEHILRFILILLKQAAIFDSFYIIIIILIDIFFKLLL